MHPVEATLYYSAALIPVALGLHPVSPFAFILHDIGEPIALNNNCSSSSCVTFRCTHWQWSSTARWELGLVTMASSGLAVETTSTCFTTRYLFDYDHQCLCFSSSSSYCLYIQALRLQLRSDACSPWLALWHLCWLQRRGICIFNKKYWIQSFSVCCSSFLLSLFKVSKIWHGQKSGEEANETPVSVLLLITIITTINTSRVP